MAKEELNTQKSNYTTFFHFIKFIKKGVVLMKKSIVITNVVKG